MVARVDWERKRNGVLPTPQVPRSHVPVAPFCPRDAWPVEEQRHSQLPTSPGASAGRPVLRPAFHILKGKEKVSSKHGEGPLPERRSPSPGGPRGLGDHVVRDGTEGIEQLCLQPGLQDQQIHVDLREQRGDPAQPQDARGPPPPEGQA